MGSIRIQRAPNVGEERRIGADEARRKLGGDFIVHVTVDDEPTVSVVVGKDNFNMTLNTETTVPAQEWKGNA